MNETLREYSGGVRSYIQFIGLGIRFRIISLGLGTWLGLGFTPAHLRNCMHAVQSIKREKALGTRLTM